MEICIQSVEVILKIQNLQGKIDALYLNFKLRIFYPNRIIIHGSNQSGQSVFARDLKNAYLTRGDFNVIVVDWSNFLAPYYQFARFKVGKLGIAVSKFITFLNPNYTTLHIVGYDLGMIKNLHPSVGK